VAGERRFADGEFFPRPGEPADLAESGSK
jgi:hypothetical protein